MTIKQKGGVFGRNPTFNNVTVDGDLSVVGGADLGAAPVIGDGSANASLTINKGASSTGTVFFKQNSTASGYIQYDVFERFISQSAGSSFWRAGNTADKLELTTTGDFKVNVGNVVLANGKGIDFSATSGTGTSELFDDYEEGTWTPVVADASSGGNTASGTFNGYYTKVGNLVTVTCSLLNINTSGMTAGNNLHIQSFPFSAASLSGTIIFTGAPQLTSVTTSGNNFVSILDNSSYARIGEIVSGSGADYVVVSEISSGVSDIYFTLTYEVA